MKRLLHLSLCLQLVQTQSLGKTIASYCSNIHVFQLLAVFPKDYIVPKTGMASVNGSSSTGHCNTRIAGGNTFTCKQPITSVLFDGHIPAITSGLNGNTWARQLLTLNATTGRTEITFDFITTPGRVERIELVMFNCPQWGVAVQTIRLFDPLYTGTVLTTVTPTITSCSSLVRVCVPVMISRPVLLLQFFLPSESDWLHLAEMEFYTNGQTCSPVAIKGDNGRKYSNEW